MNKWQPIETAPKDESSLLLLGPNKTVFSPCEWSPAGEISENGFWLWWQVDPEWLTGIKAPTHWAYPPTLDETGDSNE